MRKIALLLAGGIGERLWPLSTKEEPKQLHPFFGQPLLLHCYKRIRHFFDDEEIFVFCQKEIKKKVEEILPCVKVFAEPFLKNTAAPIALCAKIFLKEDPVIAVFPSDHWIEEDGFLESLSFAIECASEEEKIVTFGILPQRPESSYGYIKPEGLYIKRGENVAYSVTEFVEKPSQEKALQLCKEGYLWNSGMFFFKASVMIEQIKKFLPSLYKELEEIDSFEQEDKIIRFFQASPSISIDYAVMEKAENLLVVKALFKWDDLGNWDSIWRITKKGENARIGKTFTLESEGCLLFAEDSAIVAFGVKDLVVVEHKGVVLVMPREKASELKKLIDALKNREDFLRFL